jgi:hypothetical protein
VVTICTTSLTFNNSTFCPHSVFVCFVWIWEQTSIISLNNINWLVFITETECVYCAVGVRSGHELQKGFETQTVRLSVAEWPGHLDCLERGNEPHDRNDIMSRHFYVYWRGGGGGDRKPPDYQELQPDEVTPMEYFTKIRDFEEYCILSPMKQVGEGLSELLTPYWSRERNTTVFPCITFHNL